MDQQKSAHTDISLLTKEFPILSYHADMRGELSLPNLCNFFQEIAWNHANILTVGYNDLIRDNRYWVLFRMRIEVMAYPRWQDSITIHTWPKGTEALMALRDFKVMAKDGTQCAAASSGWLILDKESKRPVRLDEFKKRVPLREGTHAIEQKLAKLEAGKEPIAEVRHLVSYSDVDVQTHVNNAKYVEWILDAWHGIPAGLRDGGADRIGIFEINFLSEAFLGEEVAITISRGSGGEQPGTFYADIARQGEPRTSAGEVVRARFTAS